MSSENPIARMAELMALPIQPDLRHLAVKHGMSPGAARIASKVDLVTYVLTHEIGGGPNFGPDVYASGGGTLPGEGEGAGAGEGSTPGSGEGEGEGAEPSADGGGREGTSRDDANGEGEGEGEGGDAGEGDSQPDKGATVDPNALSPETRRALEAIAGLSGKTLDEILAEIGAAVELPKPKPQPKPKPPRAGKLDHPMYPVLLETIRHATPGGDHLSPGMTGPMGTSKTYSAAKAAADLGMTFYPITLGRDTSMSDLYGYRDASGVYQRTTLRDACDNGGLVLFDEIDLCSSKVTPSLNTLLQQGYFSWPDGVCGSINPKVRFCAAANTRGGGADATYQRSRQDGSLLDRFVWIQWDLHVPTETRIAKASYDHGRPDVVAAWIDVIAAMRAAVAALGLDDIPLSPRTTYRGASLLTGSALDVDTVLAITYLNKHEPDAQSRILADAKVRETVRALVAVHAGGAQ